MSRQCIPITTQLAYFSPWGRLLKCILVLFLNSILAFFKGLLVKYLMVDKKIWNMEYGICVTGGP